MGELIEGRQTATVDKMYLEVDPKDQTYVNVKWAFQGYDGPARYTRVYITPKSAGIARQVLKKCGVDTSEDGYLGRIDDNPSLCSGTEVAVDVVRDGNYMNVIVPVERQRVDKNKLANAEKLLKAAKKDEVPDDIPF